MRETGHSIFQKENPMLEDTVFPRRIPSIPLPPTMLDQFSLSGALPRDVSCSSANFPARVERDMDFLLSLLGQYRRRSLRPSEALRPN
jgi:hypothetical protein